MDTSLKIPFPCRINPHLEQVREANIAWLIEHEMMDEGLSVERYLDGDYARLFCMANPDADLEDMQMLVDFEMFMFVYDDQFTGARGRVLTSPIEAMGEFMTLMYTEGGRAAQPRSRLGRAFNDLIPRMTRGMSQEWKQQFFWSCQRYFVGYIHETENRIRGGERLDLTLYLKQRQWALGTEPCFDLIELVSNFELSTLMRSNPYILGMRENASDFITFSNDIDSIHKEELLGDPNNAILLLERNAGMTRAGALTKVRTMAQDFIDQFQHRAGRLRASPPYRACSSEERAGIDCYVKGLEDWMVGYYEWSTKTRRYSSENASRESGPWSSKDLLSRLLA